MSSEWGSCPECGQPLSPGRQAYKHALACLHLDDRGVNGILEQVANRRDAYGARVRELMALAQKGAE
jgi:hypothetical protein